MAENNSVTESDGDIQLKKRARRRLVGAVALALLAAIVLPMVMDHEPRPVSQDIQVRIPSQDASFTSRVLPAKPTPTPLPPAPELKQEPKAEPKPDAKPEPEPKPETKAEASVSPKAEPSKAETKPVDKVAEAARAEKILAGGSTEAAKAVGEGQWVLQLGAYQNLGNVKVLQAKVKELGYASYTEKVTTPEGDRVRVRAGPFASKEAAEKAQARLKKVGAGGPPGGVVAQK